MRSRRVRGAIAAAVLAVFSLVLMASATAGVPREKTTVPSIKSGPAHWVGPHGTYGTFGGKLPARARHKRHLSVVDNLANPSNNEIMPGTTDTYVIFWRPSGYHYSGGTTAAADTSYENTIRKYFQDVSGSQILNTTTQYGGSNGNPGDTSNFVTSIVDTTAYPRAGTSADWIKQSDLANEINSQIGSHSWPTGNLTTMYFIFLPDNVVDCNDAGSSCNTNKYCAYHTYAGSGGGRFVWADIPDNRSTSTIGGCGNSNVTGDNSADTTLSSTEHEHMEAITDPLLNAWLDTTGGENGDKCNRNMGVANASSTTADNYLGAGNNDQFRIQREWSNAAGGGGCAASYTTTGSFVESPTPSGGDVAHGVTESTIQGNNGDQLHYSLSFKNPSIQDDVFSIGVADTLPSSVSGSAPASLGDLAPQQTATRSFTGTVTGGPLLDGTVLTSSAVFSFDDSTGAAQPTITRTATTTVVNTQPTLALPGPQSQDYHDALSFGISAVDPDSGDSIALSASGLPAGLTFTDNANRTGTVSGTITDTPGPYIVTFTANDHHHLTTVSSTLLITVTKEETTSTYTGPTVVAQGFPVTLTGKLLEDGTAAPSPSGQTLTLWIGAQSCNGTVDAAGNASCTIASVAAPLGTTIPLKAVFAGDTYYLASSDTSQSAVVFAFPSRGDFVVGDSTLAAAGPLTTLTWWGSQWGILNTLSGGPSGSAFKGFAGTVTPSAPPACGGTWTTRPGDSSVPVASVPSYMGVLVSSTVTQSDSTFSGNTPKIVVVKTTPGYTTNPGHPGTGTYVATYCG